MAHPEGEYEPINQNEGDIMKKTLLASAAITFALTGAAWAQIVIATAGPMTGDYATFGAQMQAGAEQAVADINAAGGVLGQQLELMVEDDRCDPKEAVAVANRVASARRGPDGRPLLLGLVDPGVAGLCRGRRGPDLAGFDQPGAHRRASGPRRLSRLRP